MGIKIRPLREEKFAELIKKSLPKEINSLSKTISKPKLSSSNKKKKIDNVQDKIRVYLRNIYKSNKGYRRQNNRRQNNRSNIEKKDYAKKKNEDKKKYKLDIDHIVKIIFQNGPSADTIKKIEDVVEKIQTKKIGRDKEKLYLQSQLALNPADVNNIQLDLNKKADVLPVPPLEQIIKKKTGRPNRKTQIELHELTKKHNLDKYIDENKHYNKLSGYDNLTGKEKGKRTNAINGIIENYDRYVLLTEQIPDDDANIKIIKDYKKKVKTINSKLKAQERFINDTTNKILRNSPEYKDLSVGEEEEKVQGNDEEENLEDIAGGGINMKNSLTNHEIEEIMDHEENFIGTYTIDEIDDIIDKIKKLKLTKFNCIVNLADEDDFEDEDFVGHWIAIWCNLDEGDFCLFDPLVIIDDDQIDMICEPFNEYFNKTQNHYVKLKINEIPEQASHSSTCGWFCIRFILMMNQDLPFKIATGFDNIKENEKDVENLKERYQKFGYI